MITGNRKLRTLDGGLIAALILPLTMAATGTAGAELQKSDTLVGCDETNSTVVFAREDLLAALTAVGRVASYGGLDILEIKKHDCALIALGRPDNPTVAAAMKKHGVAPIGDLEDEAFAIRVASTPQGKVYYVIAGDDGGLLYGVQELTEVIRLDGFDAVKNDDQKPYMAMRGIKFNIPLDVRTPSYTDSCDAAQNNIGEMWNMAFWREFIDNLAGHRMNYVSLWNLHPFPSMVRVPEYPDVALDDVQRSTVKWREHYSLSGGDYDEPEILANVETLKKMTIDEKIAFWREVMAYGKQRNVDFYVITWNIFVNGAEGKYGITDRVDNETTRDYFAKSIKAMFVTYPDLAGVGLTTGENMKGANFQEKEDWAFDAYGQGVLDAAKELPGRKLRLIHRQHQAKAGDIAKTFAPLIEHPDIDFIFSFKYAKAHIYSSTVQTYHPGFVKDIAANKLETVWTLRNDDTFYFRWGAPDFVREFIENIPHEVSQGYYVGSDQWIWGREFTTLDPMTPRQLEVAKHWYQWMLWGRLGYDPTVSNERFTKMLGDKFPGAPAADLFKAWQAASMIYPTTTGFHWGSLDFQWYIEACKSHPKVPKTESGFNDVNHFIRLDPHPGTDNVSIPDYIKAIVAGRKTEGTPPPEVAKRLHELADTALALVEKIDAKDNKELAHTLVDIKSVALMGRYYAHKIQGSTDVHHFRVTGDGERQAAAINELTKAIDAWDAYTSFAMRQYSNPLWTNRVGHCDWKKLASEVANDVKIARETKQGDSHD